MLKRRALFGGMLAALAAPAIIRTPGLLMPVKKLASLDVNAVATTYAPGDVMEICYDLATNKAWTRKMGDKVWKNVVVDQRPIQQPCGIELGAIYLPNGYMNFG